MPNEKPAEAKNRGGRPPKLTADAPTLKALLGLGKIQCTTKEGAAAMLVSEPTFIKFLNDHPEAREAFEIGKGQGLVSLRRRQFAMSEKNPTMAIWLGKQFLGQKDRMEADIGGLTINRKVYAPAGKSEPAPEAGPA